MKQKLGKNKKLNDDQYLTDWGIMGDSNTRISWDCSKIDMSKQKLGKIKEKHRGRHVWISEMDAGTIEKWKNLCNDEILNTILDKKHCAKCGKIEENLHIFAVTRE